MGRFRNPEAVPRNRHVRPERRRGRIARRYSRHHLSSGWLRATRPGADGSLDDLAGSLPAELLSTATSTVWRKEYHDIFAPGCSANRGRHRSRFPAPKKGIPPRKARTADRLPRNLWRRCAPQRQPPPCAVRPSAWCRVAASRQHWVSFAASFASGLPVGYSIAGGGGCLTKILWISKDAPGRWCPRAELNHRHRDFRSSCFVEILVRWSIGARAVIAQLRGRASVRG